MKGLFEASESSSPLLSNFLTFYFFVVLGISCTALQTTLISKRILLSNILQKTRKTSIWVNITIPSPPHKFMKVFYQEVRVCITFIFLNFSFAVDQLLSACCVCTPVTGSMKCKEWLTVLWFKPSCSLYLAICCPLVGVQNWTRLYLALYNAQKSGCITSTYEL